MYRLHEITERLRAQGNRATDAPIFAVQQRKRIYGLDPDYCEQTVWVRADEHNEITDPEEIAELEQMESDGISDEFRRKVGYVDEWEFVQPFFTSDAAHAYIIENGHRLCDPRVYAYDSYRNYEWRAVRDDLLTGPLVSSSRDDMWKALETLRGQLLRSDGAGQPATVEAAMELYKDKDWLSARLRGEHRPVCPVCFDWAYAVIDRYGMCSCNRCSTTWREDYRISTLQSRVALMKKPESAGHPAATEKLRGHAKTLREIAAALKQGNPHFLRYLQLKEIADSLEIGAGVIEKEG